MIITVHHFLIVLFIILAFTITTFSSAEDETDAAAAEQLPTSLSSEDQLNVLTNDSSPFEAEDEEDGEEGQRGEGEEKVGNGGGFLGVLKYLGPGLGLLILVLVGYCQCCAGQCSADDGFLSLKSDRTRRVQKSTYSSGDGRDGPSRKTTLASGVSSIGTSAFVAAPKRKMKMKVRSKV